MMVLEKKGQLRFPDVFMAPRARADQNGNETYARYLGGFRAAAVESGHRVTEDDGATNLAWRCAGRSRGIHDSRRAGYARRPTNVRSNDQIRSSRISLTLYGANYVCRRVGTPATPK